MKRTAELMIDAVAEVARTKLPGLRPRYEARPLIGESEIHDAEALYGSVYRQPEVGHLQYKETLVDGTPLNDPYKDVSTFFGVFDRKKEGSLVAVERLVHKPNGTVDDLRLKKGMENLQPEIAAMLRRQLPGAIGEVGALAKEKDTSSVAVFKMHKALLAHIVRTPNSAKKLVFEMEPRLAPTYLAAFGDAMMPLTKEGETVEVPGFEGRYIPLMLDPIGALKRNRETKHKPGVSGVVNRMVGVCMRAYFGDLVREAEHKANYALAG